MNARGEVARVSVYDLTVENDNCCVVASGGDFKKFIELAENNPVIAVNGSKTDAQKKF